MTAHLRKVYEAATDIINIHEVSLWHCRIRNVIQPELRFYKFNMNLVAKNQ